MEIIKAKLFKEQAKNVNEEIDGLTRRVYFTFDD